MKIHWASYPKYHDNDVWHAFIIDNDNRIRKTLCGLSWLERKVDENSSPEPPRTDGCKRCLKAYYYRGENYEIEGFDRGKFYREVLGYQI